jgi:mannan endo-1,4-beta-mannosidase
MTVKYLRDTRKVHHLLYAISPQDVTSKSEYLRAYPGDDFVDILGLDYYKLYKSENIQDFKNTLKIVSNIADKKGKIPALTEVGLENVKIHTWWTEYLLEGLTENNSTIKTAWALIWRNASKQHHFAPYPGSPSASNFMQFYSSKNIIFETDLINMYK